MKAALLLFLLIALFAACHGVYPAYTQGHNGRPGCKTPEELTRPWKNNFDPTKYFVCTELGKPGVELQCPSYSGFLDSKPVFGCVNWSCYVPCPPYDPPSLAPMGNGCGGSGSCKS